MHFSQNFTIHPVGHGLFYSGILKLGSTIKFSMVFDCGSTSEDRDIVFQKEIEEYRIQADIDNTKILDLLIISHFSSDHVSHIRKLLEGIKVKRLVMPFVTFQERLFLVFKLLSQSGGYQPDDAFSIQFILDPLGTLKDNLDDDSEIYLIDNDGSVKPIPSTENTQDKLADLENDRFIFDFEEKELFETAALQEAFFIPTNTKVFSVNHLEKGKVKTSTVGFPLMELLFYKQNIRPKDKDIFDKIETLFHECYQIPKGSVDNIVEVIKTIASFSHSPVEAMIVQAKKELMATIKDDGLERFFTIKDFNTTALCLLHKNLNIIHHFYISETCFRQISEIQKFGNLQHRLKIPWFKYYHHDYQLDNTIFPNTLLTSNARLVRPVQVAPFLTHYKHHWKEFWLIQIPNHGSEQHSNIYLHSSFPIGASCFITYDIPNKNNLPEQHLIFELMYSKPPIKIVPITQYQGLFFKFSGNVFVDDK